MIISALAIAGVPLNKWWKLFVPLALILWGVTILTLIFAAMAGHGSF